MAAMLRATGVPILKTKVARRLMGEGGSDPGHRRRRGGGPPGGRRERRWRRRHPLPVDGCCPRRHS
eukprot:5758917-Pyramimonas_sp.AAC.1